MFYTRGFNIFSKTTGFPPIGFIHNTLPVLSVSFTENITFSAQQFINVNFKRNCWPRRIPITATFRENKREQMSAISFEVCVFRTSLGNELVVQ